MRTPRPTSRPTPVERPGPLTLGVALVCLVTGLTGVLAGGARADDTIPSREQVREAERRVADTTTDVESVRARLAQAQRRADDAAITAARAAEQFNGARHRARLARRAAQAADRLADRADGHVARQRDAYAAAIGASYRLAPGLTALSAISRSDGIATVLDRAATMRNAEDALDGRYDEFRASATLAEVAADQAEEAREAAELAQAETRRAREAARTAAAAAAQQALALAGQRDRLLADLARLEGISLGLARERQEALEAQAAHAAQAAEAAALAAGDPLGQPTSGSPAPSPAASPAPGPDPDSGPSADPAPDTPPAADPPAPEPDVPPTPDPPAPDAGTAAVMAFARAQIGEPYRWGAAGPSAWDCSGLTMMAWREAGRSLPHYSVAQYEASTPISVSSLQPGDLVFWGSGASPSTIYHVALYSGDGRIIHAPRTGRPVEETSMYAWAPPTFFARP